MGNDWLTERLAMGHGAYVSSMANRIRRSQEDLKILKKYEEIWKTKDY